MGEIDVTTGLDDLAREVNEVCRSATIDLAFRVGQIIIQRVFCNSGTAWEQGGPQRCTYRALAARGDLVLSPSALCRAVSIYVLVERLGGQLQWPNLAASHFQEVLPLAHDAQRRLLTAANEECWSVSRLRSEISRSRVRSPAPPPAARAVRSLRKVAESLARQARTLSNAELPDRHAQSLIEIRQAVELVRQGVEAVEAAIGCDERLVLIPRESEVVELDPNHRRLVAADG